MADFNLVVLVGRLATDPELKHTPSNAPLCTFALAVNRKAKDREEVMFADVVVWGKLAETCSEHLRKGRSVLIEGRLQQRAWETKEGQRRSKHEVVAERVHFLDARPAQGHPGAQESAAPPAEEPEVPF